MIPLKECKDGYLYIIHARNSSIGIFNKKDKSFTISRWKFKNNYLFDEYHWNTKNSFGPWLLQGTVKPYKELYRVPQMNDVDKLKYLNQKGLEHQNEINEIFSRGPLYDGFIWTEKGWTKK